MHAYEKLLHMIYNPLIFVFMFIKNGQFCFYVHKKRQILYMRPHYLHMRKVRGNSTTIEAFVLSV